MCPSGSCGCESKIIKNKVFQYTFVSKILRYLPHCPCQRTRQREERHIRLLKRPVPCGKGARQHHFAERRYEEHHPKESQHIGRMEIGHQSWLINRHKVTSCPVT